MGGGSEEVMLVKRRISGRRVMGCIEVVVVVVSWGYPWGVFVVCVKLGWEMGGCLEYFWVLFGCTFGGFVWMWGNSCGVELLLPNS